MGHLYHGYVSHNQRVYPLKKTIGSPPVALRLGIVAEHRGAVRWAPQGFDQVLGQSRGKPWENPWGNHGKTMGKPWGNRFGKAVSEKPSLRWSGWWPTPLKNDGVRPLGYDDSIYYYGKIKPVPNQQWFSWFPSHCRAFFLTPGYGVVGSRSLPALPMVKILPLLEVTNLFGAYQGTKCHRIIKHHQTISRHTEPGLLVQSQDLWKGSRTECGVMNHALAIQC